VTVESRPALTRDPLTTADSGDYKEKKAFVMTIP